MERSNPVKVTNNHFYEWKELDEGWADLIRSKVHPNSSGIEMAEKITLHSTEYRKGYFVALSLSEQGFIFGKIRCIIIQEHENPLLLMSCYETDRFDQHSYCYQIFQKIPAEIVVCYVSDLLDYHPLDGVFINGKINIRMKYLVIEK